MRSRTLAWALGAMVGLGSSRALANNIDLDVTISGGTGTFGLLHTDNSDFTDNIRVGLPGTLLASVSLVTVGEGVNNIDFLSAELNGHSLTLGPTGFVEFGSLATTAIAGPLTLTVRGKSGAAGGTFASYSGTFNIRQAPEPSALGLLLLGLGALALRSRSRAA
jgi:PEP-CTERM motif